MLGRKLIQCSNKKNIGEQLQQKCPFSCQSCKNPGTRKIFFDKLYLDINWSERTESIKDG